MNFLRNYWPSTIVVLVITYATLFPDPLPDDSLPLIPHLDKLIHAIMFGGMTGAIAFDRTRCSEQLRPSTQTMMIACSCAVAFGLITELLQSATGLGRSGDIFDFIADCTGILVAYLTSPAAISAVLRRFKRS